MHLEALCKVVQRSTGFCTPGLFVLHQRKLNELVQQKLGAEQLLQICVEGLFEERLCLLFEEKLVLKALFRILSSSL